MPEREEPDRRLQTTCLIILTLIASGTALYFLRPVVVPFLLAVVIVYALIPVIEWQRRRLGFPRYLAVIGAGLISLALLAAIGLIAAAFVVKLREHLPAYEAQLKQLTERVSATVKLERWGLHGADGSLLEMPESAGRQLLTSVLAGGAEVISSGALVLLFVLFMLGGSRGDRPHSPLRTQIDTAIRSYILNMVGNSALTGLLVGVTLAVLQVDFALEFGVLAFLLNFIPTIGSVVATLLPLPVILLSADLSMTQRILALVLPLVIQIVLGSIIQPRMMGKSQDLHPVTVLLAMLFFGTIWGIIGAVLAVPITGVLRIVFSHIAETRVIADWLAGNIDGPVSGGVAAHDS
jgi:AI-2 transport protein TqsA